MKFFSIILFILFTESLFPQGKPLQDKIYYEFKKEVVKVSLENEVLKITHHISEKRKFSKELGEDFTTDYVFNRSFTNLSNLKVFYGIEQEEGKSFKNRCKNISKKSGFSGGVFYDDNTYFQIVFPQIPKNGYTLIEYDLELLDPHFLKRFFFNSDFRCESSEYEIRVNNDVELGWILLGDQKNEIQYSTFEEENEVVHSWSLENASPNQYESDDIGSLHNRTHIIPYIKSYSTKDGKVPVLRGVKDLFDWYQSLLQKIKPVDNALLFELTDKIIKDEESEIGKAKAIFNWVQDNIRYIAFENGWRGFVPYPAQEISKKRFGDCKDMTHLMYVMMIHAGLDVSHGWVGTRSLPYKYELNFTPSVDNHLVIKLNISGVTYILDATNSYIPFGVPTPFILSKQVLSKSKSGFSLYTIPEFKAEDCIVENTVMIKALRNTLMGNGVKKYETYEYSKLNNGFRDANSENDKWMNAYLSLGANNFKVTEYKINNSESRDSGFIDYKFVIPNYVKEFDKSSFINFNLSRPLAEKMLKEGRVNSMEINFKKKLILKVKFVIPENYSIDKLPESVEEKFEVGSIKNNYTIENDTLSYNRIITLDQLVIEEKHFREWNRFIKVLLNVYNTSIEFKK